jgi:hypothetical protein
MDSLELFVVNTELRTCLRFAVALPCSPCITRGFVRLPLPTGDKTTIHPTGTSDEILIAKVGYFNGGENLIQN